MTPNSDHPSQMTQSNKTPNKNKTNQLNTNNPENISLEYDYKLILTFHFLQTDLSFIKKKEKENSVSKQYTALTGDDEF